MDTSPLVTAAERAQLIANGLASVSTEHFDPPPVVRLVSPGLDVVWLLSEMDPFGADIAFGLCDQGGGMADLACVDLTELALPHLRGCFHRDPAFRATAPLSTYLDLARRNRARDAA